MTRVSRAAAARWLASRGWKPFAFQREVWTAMRAGCSGLLHANTGTGKTLAAWLGALQALDVAAAPARSGRAPAAPPLTVLWLTPMRALAADSARALRDTLPDLAPAWTLGLRTGDTASAERSAQDRRLPTVLITTPESLSLQLARADAMRTLATVQLVVVDEWHELLGNKRGVQVQLALARLRGLNPGLLCWALSATLGNLDEALAALVGDPPAAPDRPAPVVVRGDVAKTIVIDTLLPRRAERFSWGGHMGLRMLPQVVAALEGDGSTLVFTNTRSQAERWYQALLEARPDWAGVIAVHHGSLSREVREWVEQGLKAGTLRAVVCTSSLDLGVDFLPVDRVLQIGSAKGIARLLQRAGRSGHAPGRPSRVTLVPTHSLELVEAAAARDAAQRGEVESRHSPQQPLDVLVQHLVTVALGGGFEPDPLYREVRGTAAYRGLDESAWRWCLDFVRQGGPSLAAYPDYQRVAPDAAGVWRVPDARLARRHRVNIGTIVSDASIEIRHAQAAGGGASLGSVEESFIARMRPGDCFLFAGRLLELVRVHQMTAYVKRAAAGSGAVPRWNGGRMPLSSTLADAVLRALDAADHGEFAGPEMACVRPLLEIQRRWSALPTPATLLAETLKSREGWHLFLYPFAGRQVHLGLASLLAWRAAQPEQATFSIAINDYGLELLSAKPIAWAERLPALLAPPPEPALLLPEVLASLNATELARRRFREIARIAGLIFQSHPGERQSNRQLQASAGLFYEVFQKYDPANLLLAQAEAELLSQELDVRQLQAALVRMGERRLALVELQRPSPFAFPLMVERFRERLTNESLADRIARMVADLETRAGGMAVGTGGEAAEQVFAADSERESVEGRLDIEPAKPARAARRRPARAR